MHCLRAPCKTLKYYYEHEVKPDHVKYVNQFLCPTDNNLYISYTHTSPDILHHLSWLSRVQLY
jgi:hypothetical protein